MVSLGPTDNKLTLIVNSFDQFYAIVHQRSRMNQGVFVPYEFRTPLVIERKFALHESLKLVITAEVYPVPEFRLAVVQIIDTVKIHVFFVPPENCFP